MRSKTFELEKTDLDGSSKIHDKPPRTIFLLDVGNSMLRRYRTWLVVMLLSTVTLFPGCRIWDTLRGEGFEDEDATWGKEFRAPPASKKKKSTEPFFLDEKSRQIEQSLGLQ